MECLFQATAYIYPESIVLPAEYSAPSMAIAAAYWKVNINLTIVLFSDADSFNASKIRIHITF